MKNNSSLLPATIGCIRYLVFRIAHAVATIVEILR